MHPGLDVAKENGWNFMVHLADWWTRNSIKHDTFSKRKRYQSPVVRRIATWCIRHSLSCFFFAARGKTSVNGALGNLTFFFQLFRSRLAQAVTSMFEANMLWCLGCVFLREICGAEFVLVYEFMNLLPGTWPNFNIVSKSWMCIDMCKYFVQIQRYYIIMIHLFAVCTLMDVVCTFHCVSW